MVKLRVLLFLFLVGCIVMLDIGAVEANNGMENIAYGAKSAGMGGTSIAVGDDTTVMNTNPAAISKVDNGRVDLNLEMMSPFFSFQNKDAMGSGTLNDTNGQQPIYLIPSAGFAFHKKDSPWYFGIGMFNEGGMGTDYGNLKVENRFLEMLPSGTPDFSNVEYFSSFGYMKLTPTVSYKITDKISVGISPQLGYAMMRMKMPFFMDQAGGGPMGNQPNGWPDTLFAADMDGNDTFVPSAKIGLLYNFYNMMGFGISYTTPADIKLKGDAVMSAPVAQMGGMIPAQARMTGDLEIKIGWPQSVKAGMFMRMKPLGGMLMAVDVEWLNWSHYYNSIPVKLSNVTMNGMQMPEQEFSMNTKWKDQWVFKVGMEYPATENLKLRMGYIYSKNPVPSEGVLAIMNPIEEHHITGGLGYEFNDHFEFNMAMSYGLKNDIDVKNKHNIAPDMLNSTTGMEHLSMSMMVSYKW